MSGTHLHAFQTDFAAALASGDPAVRPHGLAGEMASRFRVYRNNFYHGIGQQLGEAYPVVRRIVGDAFFFATARAFLDAHDPQLIGVKAFNKDVREKLLAEETELRKKLQTAQDMLAELADLPELALTVWGTAVRDSGKPHPKVRYAGESLPE